MINKEHIIDSLFNVLYEEFEEVIGCPTEAIPIHWTMEDGLEMIAVYKDQYVIFSSDINPEIKINLHYLVANNINLVLQRMYYMIQSKKWQKARFSK